MATSDKAKSTFFGEMFSGMPPGSFRPGRLDAGTSLFKVRSERRDAPNGERRGASAGSPGPGCAASERSARTAGGELGREPRSRDAGVIARLARTMAGESPDGHRGGQALTRREGTPWAARLRCSRRAL